MDSVLFARVDARADRSSNVDSARVRGTPAALLGVIVISLSGAGLGLTGCSFHAHSEWHSGKGGASSSGNENEAPPEQPEHAHRSSHRQSPGGRDNVVRVTGSHKSAGEGGGADGEEPARTAVHPTGDVPSSAGGSSASSGSGAGGSGAGGPVVGGGDGSGASGGGNAASAPAADGPAQTAEPAPAADASRDEPPSTGKGTNKSPSEPHITTPSQRKPRKVHRNGDGETNKEGRRE